MAEPLFFDCLTDAQLWSLFESGVLQSYRMPSGVYERLQRLAPDRGCVLFTWPEGAELPILEEIISGLGTAIEEARTSHGQDRETPLSLEAIGSAVEAYRERVCPERPSQGRQIHAILVGPTLTLQAGPSLEPQAYDLHAMSPEELEAYLDEVLRLDESRESAAAGTEAC